MLFYTPEFIFVFLPITLIGFYLFGRYEERVAFFWLGMTEKIIYHFRILSFVAGYAIKAEAIKGQMMLGFSTVGYPSHLDKVEGLAGREEGAMDGRFLSSISFYGCFAEAFHRRDCCSFCFCTEC